MQEDVLKSLKNIGLLSEQGPSLGFVSTGSYALNKVISGDYSKGVPIGMITQFIGASSSAKTVFATHILKEAQESGFYTILVDSENAYNPVFSESLGVDPKKLIYATPETLEDCFQFMEEKILTLREKDKDTPIVIAYDSIAVSPSKAEYDSDSYEGNNMIGAVRAKTTGACLRKINPLMRKHKVALVVVNQIRNKVGVIYGSNETNAGGGKALEYYLGVNLKCISNKTSDLLKDDKKQILGIKGTVRNLKNKVSIPFKECDFELLFDKGLTSTCGMLSSLVQEGIVERSGAWYSFKEFKFQRKTFEEELFSSDDFSELRKEINL